MWLWIGFHIVVIGLLAFDLSFSRKHEITPKMALVLSLGWIAIALLFNVFVYGYFGSERALEFLTAYLVEKSLSIDNLFIFMLIFTSFDVPSELQPRVLILGVLEAFVLRLVMILAGVYLISLFHWLIYVLGIIVAITGFKLFFQKEGKLRLERNFIVKFVRSHFKMTDKYEGSRISVIKAGVRYFTPLLLVYLAIETTDMIFALDSIPAVLAITRDPFIAYTSNVFAVLGLRSLYFLISPWITLFSHFKKGLGAVLGFIGFKMVTEPFLPISLGLSLAIVTAILGYSIVYSILRRKRAGG